MIANSSATELKQALYQLLDEGWHLFPLCWFDDQKQCICGHKDKDGKPQPHTDNNIGKVASFYPGALNTLLLLIRV